MFYILLIWVDKEFIQMVLSCSWKILMCWRTKIQNQKQCSKWWHRACVVRSPLLLLYTESPAYTTDTMSAGLWMFLLLPPVYLGLPITQMEFPQSLFLCTISLLFGEECVWVLKPRFHPCALAAGKTDTFSD